tara:strand:- start:11265 stop:12116 length:852 start_codon:yes stop_codon:yes gene_type:complete
MKVICVATEENGYYKNLKESTFRYSFELVTLGLGMKWGGFTMKFDLMQKYLQKLTNDEIVIFVDAYDVFINNNSKYIYKEFKEFNKPILFSSEFTNPNYSNVFLFENIVFNKCNKTIINSGCYMGYVYALKELFGLVCRVNDCNNHKLDDQKILNKLCNSHSDFFNKNIAIDYTGKLFYTLKCNNLKSYLLPDISECKSTLIKKDGKLINNLTNTEPFIIHGPFNLKLDNFIEYKGFHPKNLNRNSKYTIQSIKGFYKEIVFCLLIIIILLVLIWGFINYLRS